MWRHLVVQNAIIVHNNARSHSADAVTDLLRRWQWEILEHPPYSPDMSPYDYDLFAKVIGSLRGTRYNTRYELIRTIGWWLWNINIDGHADGVRRLPNIWQKVIKKGGLYWRYINVVPPWIKPCHKYRTVTNTFYLTLVYYILLKSYYPTLTGASGEMHISPSFWSFRYWPSLWCRGNIVSLTQRPWFDPGRICFLVESFSCLAVFP